MEKVSLIGSAKQPEYPGTPQYNKIKINCIYYHYQALFKKYWAKTLLLCPIL